ncbi:kinase-like domain-containing protein [Halteromyces radiatus]|uniref:kinase-like domain-containing protein n=1 Tax=Halteromyces radiatus TaxID=101107 RepID=UPI00221F821D|nr:kinase-like domain-containing protein [Halteromyces radiatus]KAI8082843.1 kinase-like domain-containing protein [Halteromyces radiatus]
MLMVQHSSYCLNLFSAWEQDGYLYLQTDIAVATLADYLQDEQETIDESITWHMIYQMAMGLQDIHHAGLVHMDLKPSNIMIDANGILKIGDFGTSIRRPLDAYEFKGEGDRHYMAPDLLREEYDAPADVFSLGLIIFEMVTRVQLPSTGDSWEMLRLGDFSNYKQQLITVPLEIRRIMLMMLKPSSRERATIDEILAVPYLQRIATNQQDPGPLYDYAQLLDQE